MNAMFLNLPAQVVTADGRNLVFAQGLVFDWRGRRYQIPSGAKTDGASTPRAIWSEIPPFGVYAPATWAHDAGYQRTLQVQGADGVFVRADLSKEDCDSLLNDLMVTLGVPDAERITIYEGVRFGGQAAFDADRLAADRNDGMNGPL